MRLKITVNTPMRVLPAGEAAKNQQQKNNYDDNPT